MTKLEEYSYTDLTYRDSGEAYHVRIKIGNLSEEYSDGLSYIVYAHSKKEAISIALINRLNKIAPITSDKVDKGETMFSVIAFKLIKIYPECKIRRIDRQSVLYEASLKGYPFNNLHESKLIEDSEHTAYIIHMDSKETFTYKDHVKIGKCSSLSKEELIRQCQCIDALLYYGNSNNEIPSTEYTVLLTYT